MKLRNYMAKNYEDWDNWATTELCLVRGPIILVRGWVKTTPDWTITAFTTRGAKYIASLDAPGTPFLSAGLAVSIEHMTEGPVVSRGPDIGSSTPTTRDQCIFLKYYTIKWRVLWYTNMKANAGPHELPGREGEDQGQAVLLGVASMNTLVDTLLDYILTKVSVMQRSYC